MAQDRDPRRHPLVDEPARSDGLPRNPSAEPLQPSHPTLQLDEHGIGWLTLDDPERKLNVLTEAVMRRLAGLIAEADRLATAGQIRALVVWSGKPDDFIVGADVDAIATIDDLAAAEAAARLGQAIFADLERIDMPTVAAIHGICLGGGTELALACRVRVASDSKQTLIGLPEVQLGILPAWGGTTRLPRLIGLQAALPILLTGEPVSAAKARRIGLVDEVLPAPGFRERARDFTRTLAEGPGLRRRKRPLLKRVLDDTAPGRMLVLAAARRSVLARTGGHLSGPAQRARSPQTRPGRSARAGVPTRGRGRRRSDHERRLQEPHPRLPSQGTRQEGDRNRSRRRS